MQSSVSFIPSLGARALTEEDRGPQQVENFILGIEEEEEVEEEEDGSEVFINNKPSGLLKLRCFLCNSVYDSQSS